ncbi:MAG: hypothetical protein ABI623_11565 [bacterium]
MRKGISAIAFAILLIVSVGCNSDSASPVAASNIQVTTISAANLPKEFNEALTFEYKDEQVNPEAVINELLNAGVPVAEAWLPLDNVCMDPVGPRFTVRLDQKNEMIIKFNFKEGSGRLECATTLKHYVVAK